MALLKNGTRIHGFGVVEGLLSVGSIITTNSTPLVISSGITRSTSNTTGTIVITNGGGLATRGNIYSGNIVITGLVNSNGITFTDNTRQTTSALEKSNTQTQSLAGSLIVGGSSVNYLQFTGNTTGGSPVLSAQGSDTNVGINLTPKGSGTVNITSNTISTSCTTGALVVSGGVGVSGNVHIQSPLFRDTVLRVGHGSAAANLDLITSGAGATNFRISSSSFATIYATGTTVNANLVGFQATTLNVGSHFSTSNVQIYTGTTGSASLKIYGEGTGAAYANIGSTTSVGSQVNIISSLPSTSHITGALVIRGGGLGVEGNVFVSSTTAERIGWVNDYLFRNTGAGGALGFRGVPGSTFTFEDVPVVIQPSYQLRSRGTIVNDTGNNTVLFGSSSTVLIQSVAPSISNTSGALVVDGGVGVKRGIYARNVDLAGGFASTSNTTGTLIITGGAGVAGNVYADAVYSGGQDVLATALAFSIALG